MESQTAGRALELFQAQIGKAEPPGEWHTVDQHQINAFADTTLDRQFIHIDPAAAAKQSPYGVTIAHGFLTLSMLSHLVSTIPRPSPNPSEGAAAMINYGLDRVRWPTPVKVNSRIRACRELLSAELKDEHTVQLKLAPKEGMELKYRIDQGGGMLYSWSATSELHWGLHSTPDNAPRNYADFFDIDQGTRSHGVYNAPFTGIHGWWWENRSDREVTITLTTVGFYTETHEFRKGVPVKVTPLP